MVASSLAATSLESVPNAYACVKKGTSCNTTASSSFESDKLDEFGTFKFAATPVAASKSPKLLWKLVPPVN